jgi:hypothetical protein
MTANTNYQLTARLPRALLAALEDERVKRSKIAGRRISLREVVQDAVEDLLGREVRREE